MTGEHDKISAALEAFKAKMQWSGAASEDTKALVLSNLTGFADQLRRDGFFALDPHPENCNRPCCD